MSRHQAVRNLDYDAVLDDYDAFDDGFAEEGDQLTTEDREALTTGTEEVRVSLGSDVDKVATQHIHDSLWYYYYDIEKTVAYLRKQFIAPPPKAEPTAKKPKEKVESLADGSGNRQTNAFYTVAGYHLPSDAALSSDAVAALPPSYYFRDMPWLNVPRHRETVFIHPPPRPGGLLGGGDGPKVSKLQALAAARKKKSEVNKKPEENEEGEQRAERAQKRFSRLSISDQVSGENSKPDSSLLAKRQKVSNTATLSHNEPADPVARGSGSGGASSSEAPDQKPMSMVPDGSTDQKPSKQTDADADGESNAEIQALEPSAFAQVLCGLSSGASSGTQAQFLPLPYASSSLFDSAAFEEPSPDDVVLAAQAKASSKFDAAAAKNATTVAKKAQSKAKPADVPTDEVNDLSLGGPPPKSKKIDVMSEFKKTTNKRSTGFVVVGHVDAGKSTLMGRLLLELKYVEDHLIERYRRQADKIGKASFALAWVMDQREDEREHGVTIDIATNNFETDKTKFTILDAPGHQDFVPNMIAGVSQADFAILVIDANTGAFEKGLKGQTREHALLLRSLGVQRVIVAVNKLDKVGWSQERFDEITEQITGFMKGNSFPLKKVCFVPISGLNGDNLVKKSADPALSWYSGPTLIEALEESEPLDRALDKPFRMSVADISQSDHGQLTVFGRIESGTVQMGDALVVQPSGETASVKSIEVDSETQDWAVAGHNVGIGLYGIDPVHVRYGDVICSKADPSPTTMKLTLKVLAFDHLFPMPVDVHRGRMHEPGGIRELPALLNKTTGEVEKKNPQVVHPGKVARVVVRLKSPVSLEAGQRIVLRAQGQTVAAGLLE